MADGACPSINSYEFSNISHVISAVMLLIIFFSTMIVPLAIAIYIYFRSPSYACVQDDSVSNGEDRDSVVGSDRSNNVSTRDEASGLMNRLAAFGNDLRSRVGRGVPTDELVNITDDELG